LQANTSIDGLAELNQPLVIIMGSEGKGVRKTLLDKSDFIVKINMANKVESLNVSTATAIILHAIFEKKSCNTQNN
jgi:23S rRNA (guanosine2251-2'-O)-methyltransferase